MTPAGGDGAPATRLNDGSRHRTPVEAIAAHYLAATDAPPRPDPHLWTRRNLDVLRNAQILARGLNAIPHVRLRHPPFDSAIGFSYWINPLLDEEPYHVEFVRIVRTTDAFYASLGRPGAAGDLLRHLDRPIEERRVRRWGRADAREPALLTVSQPCFDTLLRAMPDAYYDAHIDELVGQMEEAAVAAKRERDLGRAYASLAADAARRGRRDRANRFCDAMLSRFGERPTIDEVGGTTVHAQAFAIALIDTGRVGTLDTIAERADEATRVQLGCAAAAVLAARDGDLAAARATAEQLLRAKSPPAADRLALAFDGRPAPRRLKEDRPSDESPGAYAAYRAMNFAEYMIARTHARRGDVERAATMRGEPGLTDDSEPKISAYGWAEPAMWALEAGHADAARRAVERGLAELNAGDEIEPAEREAASYVVGAALECGDLRLACRRLLSFGPVVETVGFRDHLALARAYRRSGDAARARASLDEAVASLEVRRGAGANMARLAVELNAQGKVAQAEAMLLGAMPLIHGEDFGGGGTQAVLRAAEQMGRLDLLDRIWTSGDAGALLLIPIHAAHRGSLPEGLRSADGDDEW